MRVEDSGGGFIYRNEQELAEAMAKLAADSSLRNDLGEKGFAAYLKFWNEEAHMERYLNLIDEIGKDKGKSSLSVL